MNSLTLDQVQGAGRFAWNFYDAARIGSGSGDHFSGYVFAEGRILRLDAECGEVLMDCLPPDIGGWYHLPGCPCEFCK